MFTFSFLIQQRNDLREFVLLRVKTCTFFNAYDLKMLYYQSSRQERVLRIIHRYSSRKNMRCEPTLEPSWQDVSNDGSQQKFLRKIIPKLSQLLLLIWSSDYYSLL